MVLPLYEVGRHKRKPPYVTYGLIAANIVVAAVVLIIPEASYDSLLNYVGLIPAVETREFSYPTKWWHHLALLTSMFLHADWSHVSINMLFLWIFGGTVEGALGHMRYLVFYILCGLAGATTFVLSDPHSQSVLIGASGAISGVMAGYLVIRPCAKIEVWALFRPIAVPAVLFIVFYILEQIWDLKFSDNDDTSYWDHIGGAACGAVLIALMKLPHVSLLDCTWPNKKVRHSGSAPVAAASAAEGHTKGHKAAQPLPDDT
jgi:membrane associated rhomboid family serine protease